MRVLIVEDDVALQTALEVVLKRIDAEMTVDCASSSDQAISQIAQKKADEGEEYDLIVSDVSLESGPSGFDLWKYCCEAFPSTYFVFMSGISVLEFLDRLKDEPSCPPFLTKPFSEAKFRSLIQEVMKNRASTLFKK